MVRAMLDCGKSNLLRAELELHDIKDFLEIPIKMKETTSFIYQGSFTILDHIVLVATRARDPKLESTGILLLVLS